MIDFSDAYTTGLIVHCKTVEESVALFAEAQAAFSELDPHLLERYTTSFLTDFHTRRGDRAAYRFRASNNILQIRKDSIDWYRKQHAFINYKIIEYCTEIVDYGTDFDDQIDISYLFGGE